MTASGWLFMAASWLIIVGLLVYTLWRTLASGPKPGDSSEE